MANKKLTDLTELTTPADNDFLYIVDVSDTTESPQGTSKKIRKDKVDSGASKENIANKQNDLTPDGTGTKYTTVDAVNAVLPTTYSKVVYVNSASPTTATIFDIENPPVTNDNSLKNDTANLYIGTDASTWVYLTGTGYVTKTVSSATSNFNTFGTTVDAGNSKTSHITRSGAVTLTGPLNILNLKIATTPTTSAGSYDILTRNSSTTALEKKLISDFVQTTGVQTILGEKIINNTGTGTGKLVLNNQSSGFVLYGTNSSTGTHTVNTNSSTGQFYQNTNSIGGGIFTRNTNNSSSTFCTNDNLSTGIFEQNQNTSTGIFYDSYNTNTGIFDKRRNDSSGILNYSNSKTGSTGDLQQYLKNDVVTTYINHLGEIITMSPTAANQVATKGYADAKITQTITNGVTDKSPSEDAVFDAIDGVVKTIITDAPTSTNTGGVSEVLMHTYAIPAGKLPTLCMPNLKLMVSKTGTAGNVILKIKVNSVNNFATSVLIGSVQASASSLAFIFNRNFSLSNGVISFSNPTSLATDESFSTSAISSTSLNTLVEQYIFVSLQNSSAGDTTSIKSIKLVN